MNLLLLDDDAQQLAIDIVKLLSDGWLKAGEPMAQIIRGEIVYSQLMKRV